jgi:hypothetical protein
VIQDRLTRRPDGVLDLWQDALSGDGVGHTMIHCEFIDKTCRPWNGRRGAWILNLTWRGVYPGAPMFHFRPAFVAGALLFTQGL